ncbi:MAG: HEAT repeat domain-containing protein [Promethearchaeota archaeon]
MPINKEKDYTWLSDCINGKYKGLEKPAQIYNASIRQSLYFRLVILELMENLTSGNEEVRKNSLWMLSKIVEEQSDYKFMSPTIQILIYSLQEKNQIICYYSLKIVNEIASHYYDQFKEALPQIVENLNRSSFKIKILTAAIITQFMETESNAIQSAIKFLIQALHDKDLETREITIKALLRIDQHIDQVVQSIMESFNDEKFRIKMTKYIFEFIKREPAKVIEGLRITLKNKDDKIRANSILFMQQISLTKHAFELERAVPELLDAITDKVKVVHRTAMTILYLISKDQAQLLKEGIARFIRFLKVKDKQLLTYNIYILVQLLKYFPDELYDRIEQLITILEKSLTWENTIPEIRIVNTLSLCSLLRYKNQFTRILNLSQECVRTYSLERSIFEMYIFIGYTHYYLENYSDSIEAFLKAENARKVGDNYIATIANSMIAFNFALLRLFKSCSDYKNDALKYFEAAKDHISLRQSQKLQYLISFIDAVANQSFKKAQRAIHSYHELEPVKNQFDQQLHLINLKNLRKVKKFYLESQEILTELENNETEEDPPVYDEK